MLVRLTVCIGIFTNVIVHCSKKNNRIGMMYNVLNRMATDEKQKTLAQADYYLANLEDL